MEAAIYRLKKPLENKIYVLVLHLTSGQFASAKIDPKGTIGVGDPGIANRQIKIASPIYLGLKAGDPVTVERSRADANDDNPVSKPVTYTGTRFGRTGCRTCERLARA